MLFGKKEKKEETEAVENARVKILGSGCKKCNELEENTRTALNELGREENIAHVKDFTVIAGYGVMSTPALVVDETVLVYGKVPSVEEVKGLLADVL